jgi:hypothetical protein
MLSKVLSKVLLFAAEAGGRTVGSGREEEPVEGSPVDRTG